MKPSRSPATADRPTHTPAPRINESTLAQIVATSVKFAKNNSYLNKGVDSVETPRWNYRNKTVDTPVWENTSQGTMTVEFDTFREVQERSKAQMTTEKKTKRIKVELANERDQFIKFKNKSLAKAQVKTSKRATEKMDLERKCRSDNDSLIGDIQKIEEKARGAVKEKNDLQLLVAAQEASLKHLEEYKVQAQRHKENERKNMDEFLSKQEKISSLEDEVEDYKVEIFQLKGEVAECKRIRAMEHRQMSSDQTPATNPNADSSLVEVANLKAQLFKKDRLVACFEWRLPASKRSSRVVILALPHLSRTAVPFSVI